MPARVRVEPITFVEPTGEPVPQVIPLGSLAEADQLRARNGHRYEPISSAERQAARDAVAAVGEQLEVVNKDRQKLRASDERLSQLERIAENKLLGLGVAAHLSRPPWRRDAMPSPSAVGQAHEDAQLRTGFREWVSRFLGGAKW